MKFLNYLKSFSRTKVFFFFVGLSSIVWFLIRVIPKPSRATYPCMKAAAPIMSGFVVYVITLFASIFAFRKAKANFIISKYATATLFSLLAVITTALFFANNVEHVFGATKQNKAVLENPNEPIGEPKGYWAGRVAWVMDKDATDALGSGPWFNNTNQAVICEMLANGLKKYADTATLYDAWDCLFKYYNINHGKGYVGYTPGEKIMIKVNHATIGSDHNLASGQMVCTPEIIFALLQQLIDTVGVAQDDITIGDPYRGFPNVTYDMCYNQFPDVHYIEGTGTDGREQTELSASDVFFTSDGSFKSRLPQAYLDASYFINMPSLKSHGEAGITIAAKNHQGSVIADGQTT
jgi:hypothetical protein